MGTKTLKKAILLSAAPLFLLSGISADTISGTVTALAGNAPLDQVKVMVDATHFTFTGPDGKFTLVTDQSVNVAIPDLMREPNLGWNAEEGAFSFANGPKPSSIRLRNMQGTLVAQFEAPSPNRDYRFSATGLPNGFYVASVVGAGRNEAHKILNVTSFAQGGRNGIQKGGTEAVGLRKTAAANDITFRKAGYQSVIQSVSGSQSGLLIKMDVDPTGMSYHDFLYAGEWQDRSMNDQKMYIVRGGKIVFTYNMPGPAEYGDASLLANGNIVFSQSMGGASEINPKGEIIWHYPAPAGDQIHTCQPIGLDKVFLIQNGNPPKALIINTVTNKVEMEKVLPCKSLTGVHGQFRHSRMLKGGHMLIAHMDLGTVVEYDTATMKPLWTGPSKSVWDAVRLRNGNTLCSGNGNGWVQEINPAGQVVWQVLKDDLPGITLYTVQEVSRLENGNTIICNWTAQADKTVWPTTTQVIEVTPDKKVAWALKSWTNPNMNQASSIQILDEPGLMENFDLQR